MVRACGTEGLRLSYYLVLCAVGARVCGEREKPCLLAQSTGVGAMDASRWLQTSSGCEQGIYGDEGVEREA